MTKQGKQSSKGENDDRCSVLSVAVGSRVQNSLELKDVTHAYPMTPLLIITAAFEEELQSNFHLNLVRKLN